MHDDRAPRTAPTRRFLALLGSLALLMTGGLVAAAPATAADEDPVYWEWTGAGYWQKTFQAGLPDKQYWLATTGGGGGDVIFAAEPAGETTASLADLDLTISNFSATVVEIAGVIGDDVVPGVYEYTITATGEDATTASMVLTITIEPPLTFDGPPVFSGPTDWYISSTGTYDFYPTLEGAETATVGFPDTAYDSIWPFCEAAGSWWGGGAESAGVHCLIATLPEDGTYRFTVTAGNDNGTTVFTGLVHVGDFQAPTITATSEVKAGIGRAFPSFVPTLVGDPAPTVTIAPSGGNEVTLADLGLSLDSATGAITGTIDESVAVGSYTYTLTATGAGTASHVLTIVTGNPPWSTSPVIRGVRGQELGDLVFTWSPAGIGSGWSTSIILSLAFSEAGLEFETSFVDFAEGSAHLYGVKIADDAPMGVKDVKWGSQASPFGTTDFMLTVDVGDRPVIESSTPSTIIAGVGNEIAGFTPVTSGGEATSFSFMQTSGTDLDGLPTGLTFNSVTGAISGTATDESQVGDYGYSLVAHNAYGDSAAHAVTVRVGVPPQVSPAEQDIYRLQGEVIHGPLVTYTGATGGDSLIDGLSLGVYASGFFTSGSSGFATTNVVIASDAPFGVYTWTAIALNQFGATHATVRVHVVAEAAIASDGDRTVRQGQQLVDWVPEVAGGGEVTLTIDDAAGLAELGLEFDPDTGTISGTVAPDAAVGDHEFEVTATGPRNSDSTTVTITVDPRLVSLDLTRLGSSTVLQGGSVTVDVQVTDSLGNSIDVPASDLEVSSDVDTDVVDVEDGQFTITFPHASPHTITVTQISTGLTADITIEVTPADDQDDDGLGDTGIDAALPLGVAVALLLLGMTLVVMRRRA